MGEFKFLKFFLLNFMFFLNYINFNLIEIENKKEEGKIKLYFILFDMIEFNMV